MLEEAVGKHGSREAGTLDKHGSIVGGNLRQEIYGRLGLDEIQIVKADPKIPVFLQFDDLDLEDPANPAREIGLALNRIAQVSIDFDPDVLAALAGQGVPLEEMFSEKELDAMGVEMGGEPVEDPGADIDRAEELLEKWGVKLGDLWQVGVHRLACGDCTDAAVVERVMGGEKAGAVVTDPPYGMNFQSNHRSVKHTRIAGDEDAQLLLFACGIKARHSKYIFCRWDNVAACPKPTSLITWAKNNWSMGDLEHEHARQTEFILFYPGNGHSWPGKRPTDLVAHDRTGNILHPTEKPVSLLGEIIGWTEGIVLDPFGGSGTTMVACQNLNRQCRMIEISPAYCSVILQRMVDTFGITGELTAEKAI